MEREGERLFYGWVVVGAASAISAVGMGMLFSLGVFLRPLQEQLGWGRGEISLASLIGWTVFGLFSFASGALSDRVGTRRVVMLGGAVFGLGLALSGQARSLGHLYVTYGLVAGTGMSAFYVPLTATATRWFAANRGLAVAIVSSGNGIGILLVSPLARWLISTVGWQGAFYVLGALAWGIVLPAALLLRDRPEEMGLAAYGAGSVPAGGVGSGQSRGAEVARSPAFWAIAGTHFLCCTAHSGPIFHLVSHGIDVGMAAMTAAGMFGLSGLTSVAGRIATGMLADRFGTKRILIATLAGQATILLAYSVVRGAASLWVLSALFGFAYGGVMPLYAVVTRQSFGDRVMGGSYGAIFFISSVGMGLGSYLGGELHDASGTYLSLFLVSGAAALASVGLAGALRAPGRLPPALAPTTRR